MAALRSSIIRHYRLFSTTTSSPISISAAKSRLRAEHDPDKALEIYNNVASDANTSPRASRYTQDLTVKRLAKSRRFADIEALIESHKKDPKITQENFLCTLIRSYGIAGMFNNAYRLFDEMEELGTPRTSLSFNALLSAYNKCKRFDQVKELFDEIPQKYNKVTPDKFSYGILIKSYCELSFPESAVDILDEMEKKGIEITAISYTTILDAFYKKEKKDEAEKIWKRMIEKGCSPDVCAYNVRIMHAHLGKPKDVLAIIDEIVEKGLKPDTITYNYLFTCYARNNMMTEAMKVLKDLEDNGCLRNATSFKQQIFYLCKNGDFEKAFEVFKESVKRDKIPQFRTMKMLVEGLVESSKREEAKSVIKTVKKKFPANFLNAWKKFEEELGLNKNEESPTEDVATIAAVASS